LILKNPKLKQTKKPQKTRHPGMDSRQAVLPDALRVNANLFQTDLSRQAVLPDALRVNVNLFLTDLCRDPVAMDGNVKLHK